MTDAEYIIGLMRTESNAVGFIPQNSIRTYWMKNGNYVLQYDRHGRRRGYILHGPARPGRPLRIYQTVISYDHRLRGFGCLAVRTVIQRAKAAQSSRVLLRCATDLEANAFWLANGFTPLCCKPGGKKRGRMITTYALELTPPEKPIEKNRTCKASLSPIFSGCLLGFPTS